MTLGVISVLGMLAGDALRAGLPEWPGTRVTAIGVRGLSDGLEWCDPLGANVPAARIDVWRTDQNLLLVFTTFDAAVAGIPARLLRSPQRSSGDADANER